MTQTQQNTLYGMQLRIAGMTRRNKPLAAIDAVRAQYEALKAAIDNTGGK